MAAPLARGDNGRVGFAELFFDLVFVFAITQISHGLLYHYTLHGALETAFLFVAVWWVWIYSTWALNWLDPETTAVRVLLFGLMTAGLFMSMALPDAFGERGWVFALAYSAMQIGRSLFMLAVVWRLPQRRLTYLRINSYFLLAAVFWAWGALESDPNLRLAIWSVALAIELAGPFLNYRLPVLGRDSSSNWAVSGGHIAERCGLFVIICLGETLLVSGATFAEMDWNGPGIAAFLSAVAGSVAMWWVYFHIGHRRGTHAIEHAADSGAVARLSFTYLHIPIVAGVVLSAVGAERVIAHPTDPATLAEGASVIGGVMLFLLGNGLFKQQTGNRFFPLSHLVGLGLCLAVLFAGPFMTLVVQSALSVLILGVVAVWEHRSLGGRAIPGH